MTDSTPRPALRPHEIAKLAGEVARALQNLPDILPVFGISEAQYREHVETNEFFKITLEAERISWHSATNTQRRLATEAAMALEEVLPEVTARLKLKSEPLPAVVEGVKTLGKLAGVGETKNGVGAGEKISILIDLGEDKKVAIEATASVSTEVQPITEGQSVQTALLPIGEGETHRPAIRYEPEWTSDGSALQREQSGTTEDATLQPIPTGLATGLPR